ncbi:hypothetical protein [Zooshikella sp. RANM57]|uniref:hypothetical protein n=1 Tax=Zooshikella sp. RANM57 TaxID=3425863 RepID=UPI003D6F4401
MKRVRIIFNIAITVFIVLHANLSVAFDESNWDTVKEIEVIGEGLNGRIIVTTESPSNPRNCSSDTYSLNASNKMFRSIQQFLALSLTHGYQVKFKVYGCDGLRHNGIENLKVRTKNS